MSTVQPVATRAPSRAPRPGQVVAFGAGLAQVAAGFLAWTATGVAGLDVTGPGGPRVAASLLVLGGLALVALLVNDRGWPRVVSGTLTGLLVVAHLRGGPDGALSAGVVLATWAAIGQWFAAALATGPLAELARIRLR